MLQLLADTTRTDIKALSVQLSVDDVTRVIQLEPDLNTADVPWIDNVLKVYAGAQLFNSLAAFKMLLENDGKWKEFSFPKPLEGSEERVFATFLALYVTCMAWLKSRY